MFIQVSILVFHLILLHGAKGITRGKPTYLRDYLNEGIFLKLFPQKSSKKLFKSWILKNTLCQILCKRFKKLCRFEKFWNPFTSFFFLPKNNHYNVQWVFLRTFYSLDIFQINSHVPMIQYKKFLYFQHQIKSSFLNMKN
jgi:hypothetical protein